MALHRDVDPADPYRPEPVTRFEERRTARTGSLGAGTLACPRCDAPVALPARTAGPADGIGCPFCGHAARVRDFLTLEDPARPARVNVRVVPSRRV